MQGAGGPRAQEVHVKITPVSPVPVVTGALAVDSEAGSSNPSLGGSTPEAPPPSAEPVAAVLPEAFSTGYGSLLLPSTGTSLLKLMAEEAVPDTHTGALTSRQWLARYMALSLASPARLPEAGDANHYALTDLDMIKAATGYNFVVLDGATAVVDDEGHPAPDAIGRMVQALAAKVSGDRAAGLFFGEGTPEYLRAAFAEFADEEQPLPERWLDKALGYLHERGGPGAAHADLLA